ncbi:DNA methyltransferase [Rubripirellula reticaptiva]|nr:DNA methyltransferase [Rubripirellula reticaptiva]
MKLQDPEFRKIEGFPIAEDEDILALSDPPYYTACPNPFLKRVAEVRGHETATESGSPFASDVTEGKGDPIYDAHPYHTKVPPKALMRMLLHFTKPGDLVLDAFAGSGMLGVAASLCENPTPHLGDFEGTAGARSTILSDISPLATFISHVNNRPSISAAHFSSLAASIRDKVASSHASLYQTRHHGSSGNVSGEILYTIWTEYYRCSHCNAEFSAWDELVDRDNQQILKHLSCPECDGDLAKDQLERVTETYFDTLLNATAIRNKSTPVLIHYTVGKKRFEKTPDEADLEVIRSIEDMRYPASAPPVKINFEDPPWGDFYRPGYHAGMTHAHHFYTKRNLLTLCALRDASLDCQFPRQMLYVLTAFVDNHASKRNRYLIDKHHPKGTTCGPLPNSLYIPELQCEVNPFRTWDKTVKKQKKAFAVTRPPTAFVSTEASRLSGLSDGSIDYVFVDPPFGKNILYAESSFCFEYFLKVFTNRKCEAIVSKHQGKTIDGYQDHIQDVFSQCFRVLKPGKWMTIEFSNRSNAVWNSISEAVQACGFVIADVRVFDKKQGTIRQDLGQSIKKDLIISAYKPGVHVEETLDAQPGSEVSVWEFVSGHLKQLPVFLQTNGKAEVVVERQKHVLFDRMVAFHVQRSRAIPVSAPEFHLGLEQRFPQRDSMFFLPEQVLEYDKKRLTVSELTQLELFVSDESSAIQWLKQELKLKPQSFQEIHPHFIQQLNTWDKNEKSVELAEILEENFLCYDGADDVPSQIHGYLSSNFKELRNLEKSDERLKKKATDRWYLPDPRKEGDLEKVRVRALMKEFRSYEESRGKLKQVRSEALRAGFKERWQSGEYAEIVALAKRVKEAIIQEDPALLMYYDNAMMLTDGA